MTGMLRVPRSRGALSGLLLVLLGAWGALIPFIGPSFHYAYTPDSAWAYTTGRFWLEILPGVGTMLGGLIVLASSNRPFALFGAWLAALSGAWFALGSVLAPIWSTTGISMSAGTPVGGTVTRVLEQVGFFTGLGVVIVGVAAMALGRFSVIGVRETRQAERAAQEARAEQEAAAKPEPVAPASTEPVAAASTERAAAASTDPVAPATTEPNAPATTEPVAPVATQPNAPATTEPVAPVATEPKAPATAEPVAPATTEPNASATTGARRFVPGRKTAADAGTTTADTSAGTSAGTSADTSADTSAGAQPDTERVDSTTAAQ